jgi:uncharacterized protein (UPF0276 family)
VLGRLEEEDLVTRVQGVGLGLRWEFLDALVDAAAAAESCGAEGPKIDFLEVSPENYMRRGGMQSTRLGWLADRYPVVTHGLTMSLGGTDPLDDAYLRDLSAILTSLRTPWHSDHMCFGAVDGTVLHELLPVPFKDASVAPIAERIRQARDAIGLPLAVENVSYYWHPGRAEMGEAEFLARVCDAADCGLVLDVNNAYVNSVNFGFDVDEWMRTAPIDRVVQVHIAGHEWFASGEGGIGEARPPGAHDGLIVDTHGAEVADPVLSLLERVLSRTGRVPVLLERDQNIPPFCELLVEIERIRAIWERA